MTISIIAAIAENNVIGKDNDLIWYISEDLKRFKALTSGHPIIMGRKTYESLPFKPLPKRKNIVISNNSNLNFDGAIVVNTPEEALQNCNDEDEVFICGGASIYEYFLPKANKMYLTEVHFEFEGDTFFPDYKTEEWRIEKKSDEQKDVKSDLTYKFVDYVRKRR